MQERVADKDWPSPELHRKFVAAVQLRQQGQLQEAALLAQEILRAHPKNFPALCLLGSVQLQLGTLEEAVRLLGVGTHVHNHPMVFFLYGQVLAKLGRLQAALTSYDQALALKPDFAQALLNRGLVLQQLKRTEESMECYDRVLALNPGFAKAHNNRGNLFLYLNRPEEALACYDRALALRPDFAMGYHNRGVALQQLRRFDEAFMSFDRALALQPDYSEAHVYKGMLHLLLGNFDRGWEEYEWRKRLEGTDSCKNNQWRPHWTGAEDLNDKSILLHAEQGLGDVLHFCRYVPFVQARGARVFLHVPPSLKSLLEGMAGVDGVLSEGADQGGFDYHCLLVSLPFIFKTTLDTIPVPNSYLAAPADKVANWKARIAKLPAPRIGLVWSGSLVHQNDRNRSIPLGVIVEHLDQHYAYVALQTEVRPDDRKVLAGAGHIRCWAEELKDFSDTAALIEHLDLIISVDTSVVHLAGALGKPVWVLLPYFPDWRWMLDRTDSPWYPTVRLFRQSAPGDWRRALDQVRGELARLFGPQAVDTEKVS